MLNWIPAVRWLYGLFAAIIGGGASAVTAGLSANLTTPGQYNLSSPDATWNLLKLVATTFTVNGIISAFLYLQKAPLPKWDGIEGSPSDRRESSRQYAAADLLARSKPRE